MWFLCLKIGSGQVFGPKRVPPARFGLPPPTLEKGRTAVLGSCGAACDAGGAGMLAVLAVLAVLAMVAVLAVPAVLPVQTILWF